MAQSFILEEGIDMECIVIGVLGETGSRKSTFTSRIKQEFGDQIVVVYHDNYYKNKDGISFEERKKINYDHPDALEEDLLVKHLRMLKCGITVDCPIYDYSVHNRFKETVKIEPRKVIVVEACLFYRMKS